MLHLTEFVNLSLSNTNKVFCDVQPIMDAAVMLQLSKCLCETWKVVCCNGEIRGWRERQLVTLVYSCQICMCECVCVWACVRGWVAHNGKWTLSTWRLWCFLLSPTKELELVMTREPLTSSSLLLYFSLALSLSFCFPFLLYFSLLSLSGYMSLCFSFVRFKVTWPDDDRPCMGGDWAAFYEWNVLFTLTELFLCRSARVCVCAHMYIWVSALTCMCVLNHNVSFSFFLSADSFYE